MITLGLYPVDDPTSYGLVRRDDDGEVLGFLEKPDPDEIDTDEINAGAYVIERQVLDLIPPGRAVSIEREVFPRLVGQGLYGRRLEGYWMDIGTPRALPAGELGHPRGHGRDRARRATAGRSSATAPRSRGGATVEPRAVRALGLRRSAEGALIADSVLLDGCRVGAGAEVRGSILAAGVDVGAGATIGAGSVIGAGATVEAGVDGRARARGSSPTRSSRRRWRRERPRTRSARSTRAASSTTSSRCPSTCATRSGGSSRPASSPRRPAA